MLSPSGSHLVYAATNVTGEGRIENQPDATWQLYLRSMDRDRAFAIAGLGQHVGQRGVRLGVALILLDRLAQLFLGDIEAPLARVIATELGVDPRGFAEIRRRLRTQLAAGFGDAAGQRYQQQRGSRKTTDHCTLTGMSPSRFLCFDCTLPTSCPQAASMSSPRVRRVIVSRPLARRMSEKRVIASGRERL